MNLMNFKSQAVQSIKQLRVSQPFNYLTTTAARALLNATGKKSERAIQYLHRSGVTRVRLPNGHYLRLWSRGDDWVSTQIFWRGWDGYEPETVPLFFRLAQRSKTIFDVGSHVGYFTLLAAHASPRGQVYAFEPLSGPFGRLQRNVHFNGLRNVVCTQTAVGESEGTAEFFHVAAELPTSSSLSYAFMESADNLTHSEVPVVTLDNFVRQHHINRVDLMKIDTESTEPDVLRGMSETLKRDHPTMICEVLHQRNTGAALEEILKPLGYHFYLLTPDGPQQRQNIEGQKELFNYLLTTKKADEVKHL